MACLLRLIARLALLKLLGWVLLAVVVPSAHAVTSGYRVTLGTGMDPTVYSSRQALCDAQVAFFGTDTAAKQVLRDGQLDPNGPQCRHASADWQQYDWWNIGVVEGSCVIGMEPGPDGICVCKAGTHDVAGTCVPNKSELEDFCQQHAAGKHTFNQTGTIGSTSPTPQSSCYKPYPPFPGDDATKGCQMSLRDMVKAPSGDGVLMNWSGTGIPTGGVCEDAVATDSQPKSSEDKCKAGFSGTFNGTQVCIPAEPDKGIEGVKTGSKTDANGTKHDTKEETKCEGTTCTTTTTTTSTTTSNSVSTSTTSVTESLSDKCAKDPTNKVCTKTGTTGGGGKGDGDGTPSSFGGSCAGGFKAVSEDAVLNAMAEEQYRRNCELLRTDSEPSTWLQAESQKTGDRTGDLPGNKDVSISGADIDTSDALGGGGCNLDRTITVAKMSVTLPFGKACQPLEVFGQLLVAVSMLLAGRIIMRG